MASTGARARALLVLVVVVGALCMRTHAEGNTERFCAPDPDNNNECDWAAYGIMLLILIVPGFVIAGLSFIFAFCFFTLRVCCNTFGGRSQSTGCCCPDSEEQPEYTKNMVWGLKIGAVVAGVLVFTFTMTAIGGNTQVHNGIEAFVKATLVSASELLDNLTVVQETLEAFDDYVDIGDVENALVEGRRTLDVAEDFTDEVVAYDDYRVDAILVSIILPLILVLFGVVMGLLNLRIFALLAAFLICITLTMVWISFSLHYLFGSLLGDLCYEIGLMRMDSPETLSFVDVMNCDENTFSDIYDITVAARDEAIDDSCVVTEALISAYNPVGWPSCNDTNYDSFYLRTGLGLSDGHDTIKECADNGTCSEQIAADAYVTAIDAVAAFELLINTVLLDLLNCVFVDNLFFSMESQLCDEIMVGIDLIAASNCIVGITGIASVVIFTLGSKRFTSDYNADPDY